MNTRRIVAVLAVGTVLLSALAFAQEVVYEWTDENGVVQRGETPPDGVDARPFQAKAPPPVPKKTPLADEDLIELIERCNAAREAEIRACKNEDPDNSMRCDDDNGDFARKLANLPDCVELEAETERRKGER